MLFDWLVDPPRLVAWLVDVVVLGSVQSGWVAHGFVGFDVTCLIQVREMMFAIIAMLLWPLYLT